MTFSAAKLRGVRLRLGLTQRDVGAVAQATLSAIESGRQRPHPSTLRKLATEYGVSVSDFFEEPATSPKAALPPGFDIVEIVREIVDAEQPEDPTEFRSMIDERVVSRLEGLPKETLVNIRDRLRVQKRQLNQPRTLEDLMQNPDRTDALYRAWGELRAVNLTLAALDRVLTEA